MDFDQASWPNLVRKINLQMDVFQARRAVQRVNISKKSQWLDVWLWLKLSRTHLILRLIRSIKDVDGFTSWLWFYLVLSVVKCKGQRYYWQINATKMRSTNLSLNLGATSSSNRENTATILSVCCFKTMRHDGVHWTEAYFKQHNWLRTNSFVRTQMPLSL